MKNNNKKEKKEKKQVLYKDDPILDGYLREIISNNVFSLGYLSAALIKMVRVENKKTRQIADIRSIKYPSSLFTDKHFIVSVYAEKFDQLDEQRQKLIIAHELMHINREKEKSLLRHDKEDFRKIMKVFGIDWCENSDLPDVISTAKNEI